MALSIHRNWIILALALVIGLGAALLAMRHLDDRAAAIERSARVPMARAVVAKEDLAPRTRLGPANVAIRDVPAEWLPSGAIRPEEFDRADSVALAFPAVRGEPILWAQLEGKRAPTFSARLARGRRAVTVPVDEISSISGMLEPGDRIDLLVTVRRDNRHLTFALLQNVGVLATGVRADDAGTSDERTHNYTTITLDTTPEDAKRIVAARTIGTLTAMLRAPGDTGAISTARADAAALLGLGDPATGGAVPVIYGGLGQPLPDMAPLLRPAARLPADDGSAFAVHAPVAALQPR